MAALALIAGGVAPAEAERALAVDPHVPGRMERVVMAPGAAASRLDTSLPLVVVDYAHTPDAVAAALKALRPSATGALVVVLGAGGDRDRGKRAAMGRAAAEGADIVVVTDDNPRTEEPSEIRAAVLEGARAAGTSARLEDVAGRAVAIAAAVRAAHESGPGSVVAVVGRGTRRGRRSPGTVHPFDDRAEARRALEELAAAPGAPAGSGSR